MDKKKIHIDDLYREELGNHTETPPPAVWESLNARLDNKQPNAGPSFRWMWWIGSAIVVLSLLYFTGKSIININGTASTTPAPQDNSTVVTNPNNTAKPTAKQAATETDAVQESNTTASSTAPAIEKTNTTEERSATNSVKTTLISSATKTPVTEKQAKSGNASPDRPHQAKTDANKIKTAANAQRTAPTDVTSIADGTAKFIRPRKQNNTPITTRDASSEQPELITVTTTASTPAATPAPAQRKLHAPRVDTNTRVVPASAEANLSHLANINLAHAKMNNYVTSAATTENTPKNNNSTTTENNAYAGKPASGYTPPAKELHATAPVQLVIPAAQAITTSNTVIAAPAQATTPAQTTTASKNDIAEPAKMTNPKLEPIRKVLPFTFNYGAKVGYEFAKGDYHVNSYVFSPYLQYNLTRRLSLVLQPGIKSSTINNTYLDPGQSYYNITSAKLDSNHQKIQTSIDTTYSPIYGAVKPKYYYTQTHDSIVTSTTIAKKTYFEFELPILVQYEVVRHMRVYGGISANFSRIVAVIEHREEYKNITLKDSVILKPQAAADPAPPIPTPYSKFAYSYLPYSQYNNIATQNPVSSPVRFSYMLGFNYQVWRKFSIDVLMQGLLSNPSYIYDTRVRSLYQQTHFRISLGYQFGK